MSPARMPRNVVIRPSGIRITKWRSPPSRDGPTVVIGTPARSSTQLFVNDRYFHILNVPHRITATDTVKSTRLVDLVNFVSIVLRPRQKSFDRYFLK